MYSIYNVYQSLDLWIRIFIQKINLIKIIYRAKGLSLTYCTNSYIFSFSSLIINLLYDIISIAFQINVSHKHRFK